MVLVIIFCVVLGAVLGSFSCCQAWRIRYKVEKKGELGKRSVCLSCGKKLRWYENMPIVSWVLQRGKCRKCGKKIGTAEIMSEVLGGVFGGMVGVKFLDKIMTGELGDGITKLLFYGNTAVLGTAELWLMITEILLIVAIFTTMGIIAIYDAKWGEMPAKLLWVTVGLGVVFAGIGVYQGNSLFDLGISVLLLAGTYYILYKVSREKWVGGGDWILCLSIALVLGEPLLALVELSLANFLGMIVMLPRKKRGKMIPMGPFFVVAGVLIFSFSDLLINMI